MNSINIIGRLTKDPETKETQSGKTMASFSIACDRIGDGTDFFNVTAFGKTAEVIDKYFHKGSQIAITGRLQQKQWETKDGKKMSSVDIIADQITFCGKKESTGFKEIESADGDLPF